MMLTDAAIRKTKPTEKAVKLTDGAGLYLEVTPSGGRNWRYRFRLDGKESTYAIGDYPRIGLAEARQLRNDARALVKAGTNPAHDKKEKKLLRQYKDATTFRAVGVELHSNLTRELH